MLRISSPTVLALSVVLATAPGAARAEAENGPAKKAAAAPAAPAAAAPSAAMPSTVAPSAAAPSAAAPSAAAPSAAAPSAAVAAEPAPDAGADWSSRLTGGWGGARQSLLDRGLDLSLVYKGEFNRNLAGGLSQDHAYLTNVDLKLAVDAEKLFGWTGGHIFFYGLYDHGQHPSAYNGDVQSASNIETSRDAAKLYEAWIQQDLAGGKASILAGLHDLNSEFYVCDDAGLFFNSSFGIGKDLSQTGVNGPSIFPTTAPALRFRADPAQTVYLQVGLFNAQSGELDSRRAVQWRQRSHDGTLAIGEFGLLPGAGEKDALPTKLAVGAWTYTRTFDDLDGSSQPAVSDGAYILADKALSEHFAVFGHYGIASANVNRFAAGWATGVVVTGPLPTRGKDRFGVGYSGARNGERYRDLQDAAATPATDAETAIELNYRIELLGGVALQPDYQFIRHPGTDPSRASERIGAVRLEVSL